MKKKLTLFITILIILEFSSFTVLKINESYFTEDFIFDYKLGGKIIPNNEYVLPVKKNFRTRWKTTYFDISIKTNSIGIRDDADMKIENLKIAFLGDSFAFGHGVNIEDSYVSVFKKKVKKFKNTEIASLSYLNGYQPEHYEYFLKANKQLNPKHIILSLYLGNDLYGDLIETDYNFNQNKLELKDQIINRNGQRVQSNLNYIFPFNHKDKSNFINLVAKIINITQYRIYLFNNPGNFHATNPETLQRGLSNLKDNRAIKSLIRIKEFTKINRQNLIIVIIPEDFYFVDSYNHLHISKELKSKIYEIRSGQNLLKQTVELLDELEFTYINLGLLLQDEDYNYGHWSIEGNNKVGNYIVNFFNNNF